MRNAFSPEGEKSLRTERVSNWEISINWSIVFIESVINYVDEGDELDGIVMDYINSVLLNLFCILQKSGMLSYGSSL